MNSIVQIVRQRIWWILLVLVILGLFFFRRSIFGFKEGAKKGATEKKPVATKPAAAKKAKKAKKAID